MKLLKGLHIGYIRQPWTCPGCGDSFAIPNERHSCPEHRHFRDRRKARREGMMIGCVGALFVFMFIFILILRNLVATYADVVAFMQEEMATIHQVNKVILDSQGPQWGGEPEPPRRFGR